MAPFPSPSPAGLSPGDFPTLRKCPQESRAEAAGSGPGGIGGCSGGAARWRWGEEGQDGSGREKGMEWVARGHQGQWDSDPVERLAGPLARRRSPWKWGLENVGGTLDRAWASGSRTGPGLGRNRRWEKERLQEGGPWTGESGIGGGGGVPGMRRQWLCMKKGHRKGSQTEMGLRKRGWDG